VKRSIFGNFIIFSKINYFFYLQHWPIIQSIVQYINANTDKGLSNYLLTNFQLTENQSDDLVKAWCGKSLQEFNYLTSFGYSKKMLGLTNQSLLFDASQHGDELVNHAAINLSFFDEDIINNEFKGIEIILSQASTAFGKMQIAETQYGVCEMSFTSSENNSFTKMLQSRYPKAIFTNANNTVIANAVEHFFKQPTSSIQLNCTVLATAFQKMVWQHLVDIPFGKLVSYGQIADKINENNASRAVGTAVGKNPIGYFLPCHRVVQANGSYGHYMWGAATKAAIIGWEAAKKYIHVV
jgi:AraC family transcriptional regulator, regulatory protein of adaptative response / methylated-DNA-[protein]-cysteine methyltransferase